MPKLKGSSEDVRGCARGGARDYRDARGCVPHVNAYASTSILRPSRIQRSLFRFALLDG
jgi:hypothetical protein